MKNTDTGIEMFEVVLNDHPVEINDFEAAEIMYNFTVKILEGRGDKVELYSVHYSPEGADGERVEIERELLKDNL